MFVKDVRFQQNWSLAHSSRDEQRGLEAKGQEVRKINLCLIAKEQQGGTYSAIVASWRKRPVVVVN